MQMVSKRSDAELESFQRVKRQILSFIASIREVNPEAAEYLEQHFVMDEKARTFMYTGDNRIQIEPVLDNPVDPPH